MEQQMVSTPIRDPTRSLPRDTGQHQVGKSVTDREGKARRGWRLKSIELKGHSASSVGRSPHITSVDIDPTTAALPPRSRLRSASLAAKWAKSGSIS